MDKLRSRTNLCLKSSRLGSRGQRVYGQKSCQAYYGHIGQQPKHLQGICFRLAYESEAVILVEVGVTSYKVDNHDEKRNDEAMRLQLDLMDEVRATTEQRLAWYEDLMAKHYNSKVRHRDFKVGDLVLKKVTGATKDPSQGKLSPN